jgi:cytochrome b6
MASPARAAREVWGWLDRRFDLAGLERFLRHKEVPLGHHSLYWYFLGGLTLFFFIVQILSGILLLMYYQAGESTSYESMRFIVTKVPFGWLVRAVHCWSAHLMILTLLLHMWSVFFLRAYRNPRELTWLTGMGLFGIALGFGFSGYLLPWNELSYFATAVGTDSVKAVPVVGEWLLRVMRGGEEVSIRTLYRFYALHVCVLPIAAFSVIGVHLLLVQKQGMAEPVGDPGRRRGMPFFPNFLLRDLLLWILAVNLLALLAVLLPYGPGIPGFEWELGLKADPLKPAYPGIKPEWYFLWMYQLLKEFPSHFLGLEGPQACLLLATVMLLAWALVPFLDRRSAEGRPGPAFTDFGVGVLFFLGFLMLKAWDIGAPHVAHGVDPTATPAAARQVARTAAAWLLGGAILVTLLRALVLKQRWFWISALPVLHAVLHGFLGMNYLVAGAICLGLFAARLGLTWNRSRRIAVAAALVVLVGAAGRPALAEETPATGTLPPSSWPAPFQALIEGREDGRPVVSDLARRHFEELPSYAQEQFFAAQKRGLLTSAEQLNNLLSLEIPDEHVELLIGDNCVLCHTNPDNQFEETLFKPRTADDPNRHLDLRQAVSDVHMRRGLSCSGCHGGHPTDDAMTAEIYTRWPLKDVRHGDRSWIPGFCTERCHSQPGFMRRFNPALPVDQMIKYRESRHGVALLVRGNERAAQCISCHGVHGILKPTSPNSKVYPANIPQTCGACHANPATMKGALMDDGRTPLPTDQLAKYTTSVHGKALLERHDLGAPACNDCHGNHAAMPPDVASVSQICRNCHVNNGKLFDGSPHKAAFERHGWPECEVCHGKHEIARTSDAMLGTGPGSVCKNCHDRYGRPECNEIAQHFHDEILRLGREREEADAAVAAAEERGLDLADLHFDLAGVGDVQVEGRSRIHAFNLAEFDKTVGKGLTTLQAVRQATGEAIHEHGLRKVGLLVSTLFVTLLAGVLSLKIREIDRRGGGKAGGDAPDRAPSTRPLR